MAKNPPTSHPSNASKSRFDLANWNKGKVTLFQAFGLTGATYPELSSTLTAAVALHPQAGTVVSGDSSTGSSSSNANVGANEALGKQLAATYGWGSGPAWEALNNIVMSESGWNNNAQNSGSTAYGIGQFLDTTWSTVGYAKTSDPKTQILAMLAYIKLRYKTPQNAWAFHQANGYY